MAGYADQSLTTGFRWGASGGVCAFLHLMTFSRVNIWRKASYVLLSKLFMLTNLTTCVTMGCFAGFYEEVACNNVLIHVCTLDLLQPVHKCSAVRGISIFLRFKKAREANLDSKQGVRYCQYEIIGFSWLPLHGAHMLLLCYLCYQSSVDRAE